MKLMKKACVGAVVSLALVAAGSSLKPGYAETINLKSGEAVVGIIVENAESYIRVQTPKGVSMYFRDDIKSIAGGPQGTVQKEQPSVSAAAVAVSAERATAYLAAKKFREAALEFEKIVAAQPENFKAWADLGNAYLSAGLTQEAVVPLEKAARPDSVDAAVFANLGAAYVQTGQPARAIGYLNRAVSLKPEHAAAHFTLGSAYQALGESRLAVTHLEKAIELAPDLPALDQAYSSLGLAYSALAKPQEAAGYFEKAVQLNPRNQEAFFGLGALYAAQGDRAKAREFLLQAKAICEANGDYKSLEVAERLLKDMPR